MLKAVNQELIEEIKLAVDLDELNPEAAYKIIGRINKVCEKHAAVYQLENALAPTENAARKNTSPLRSHTMFTSPVIKPTEDTNSKLSYEAENILEDIASLQFLLERFSEPNHLASLYLSIGTHLVELARETEDTSYNEQALDAFNNALTLDPNLLGCREARAKLYVSMGEYNLAQEGLNELKARSKPKDGFKAMRLEDTLDYLEKSLEEINAQQKTCSA